MHHYKTVIHIAFSGFFIILLSLNCTMNIVQADLFSPQNGNAADESLLPYQIHRGIIDLENAASSEYLYLTRRDAQAQIIVFGGRDWISETGIPLYKALSKTVPLNIFFAGYRGYGKGEGTPSTLTIKKDAEAVFEYYTKRMPGKKNLPLYIFGYSLGGYTAAALSGKNPVSGIILVSTFSNSQELVKLYLDEKIPSIVLFFFNFKIEAPLLEMDTVSELGKYSRPLLVIHGKDDYFIPDSMSGRIFEASLSSDKKLVQIENCGHDQILDADENLLIVSREIADFIIRTK